MIYPRRLKYVRFGPIIALVVLALMSATLLAAPAGAQTPTCQSAASDSDGDGWGWENNASCIVSDVNEGSSTSPAAIDQATRIECANDFDPDGCLLYTSPSPRDRG